MKIINSNTVNTFGIIGHGGFCELFNPLPGELRVSHCGSLLLNLTHTITLDQSKRESSVMIDCDCDCKYQGYVFISTTDHRYFWFNTGTKFEAKNGDLNVAFNSLEAWKVKHITYLKALKLK